MLNKKTTARSEPPIIAAGKAEAKSPGKAHLFKAASTRKRRHRPAQAVPGPKESLPAAASAAAEQADRVEMEFVLYEPHAREVFVSGEFNGWQPNAIPMRSQGDGHWKATVALPWGRHQYKFVVDGQWLPDVGAAQHVRNEFGTLNSILEVPDRPVHPV